jgi:hypothetical protein
MALLLDDATGTRECMFKENTFFRVRREGRTGDLPLKKACQFFGQSGGLTCQTVTRGKIFPDAEPGWQRTTLRAGNIPLVGEQTPTGTLSAGTVMVPTMPNSDRALSAP